jgi:hypothetical protein
MGLFGAVGRYVPLAIYAMMMHGWGMAHACMTIYVHDHGCMYIKFVSRFTGFVSGRDSTDEYPKLTHFMLIKTFFLTDSLLVWKLAPFLQRNFIEPYMVLSKITIILAICKQQQEAFAGMKSHVVRP